MTILLLDDERSWVNPTADHVTVRTVEEAIEYVDSLTVIDEIWFDYILQYGTTEDFARYLATRARNGNPLTVGKAYFHSSAFASIGLMNIWLAPAGIELELVDTYQRSQILK